MNRELKTFNSSLFPLLKYIYFKWLSFKILSFTRKWWFCLVLIRTFRQTLPDSLWSCLSQLSKLLVVFLFLWNHWLAFIRIHLPYSYLAIPVLLKSQNLPDWKSPEWAYCPNLNAPVSLFSSYTGLIVAAQNGSCMGQVARGKKNATNSLWKSNGKCFQFQDVINTTCTYFAASFVWLSYLKTFKMILFSAKILYVCFS